MTRLFIIEFRAKDTGSDWEEQMKHKERNPSTPTRQNAGAESLTYAGAEGSEAVYPSTQSSENAGAESQTLIGAEGSEPVSVYSQRTHMNDQ